MDFHGKSIAEESANEINKMLYRIKDFEQVYNIAERNFRVSHEDFQVKRAIDEVVDIAKPELIKKNMHV